MLHVDVPHSSGPCTPEPEDFPDGRRALRRAVPEAGARGGGSVSRKPAGCPKRRKRRRIVASNTNTHNPPVVNSRADDTEKKIAVAEAERLMLWPAGVTDGWCAKVEMNHDRVLRTKMIGSAISGQHLRENPCKMELH